MSTSIFKELLQEAHDKMDDANVEYESHGASGCLYCEGEGYNENGQIHQDDCILVRIRRELNG